MPKPISDEIAAEPDPAKKEQIRVDAIMAHHGQLVGNRVRDGVYWLTLDTLEEKVGFDGVVIVALTVTITKQNQNVTPPDLNPIAIRRPPMLIADPDGDVVPPGHPGQMYRESPGEALVVTLTDLLAQIKPTLP